MYCDVISGIIAHFGKYHNTLCLSPKILHTPPFFFSWDHCKSQEKLEKMLMQNLGGGGGRETNKEHYGISELAYSMLLFLSAAEQTTFATLRSSCSLLEGSRNQLT